MAFLQADETPAMLIYKDAHSICVALQTSGGGDAVG